MILKQISVDKILKIGIDAKWFFSGPESGKVVVANLVENLIKINKKNRLYIFLDKKYRHADFPFKNENVKTVYIWRGINLISNLFVIPYYAKALGIDVVLFQYFISVSSKFINISFIHDIFFLTKPDYYTFRNTQSLIIIHLGNVCISFH